MNDEERIILWAALNCERNNVKWLGTPDVCPLQGDCTNCRERAREALRD